ncbi:MAG: hypothetical protein ACYDCJ_07695 [Gammaproteobacteria bacterium]
MNAWKYLLGILVVPLAINLFGCAVYKPDYSSFIQEANNRHAPLLIYNTSWNDPQGGGGRLAVWVANNQDKQIDSIELTVAACGAKGAAEDSEPLVLGGPFYGHTKYVSLPSWPIDARYYPGAGYVYADAAKSSGHMVIQSIKITYSDSKQEIYNKDVDQLLTKNISNYCPSNINASY